MKKSKTLSFLWCCLGIALFVAPISHARAALFSGAYLMELCKRDDKGREVVKTGHTACQSYISGVMDYHTMLRSLGTPPTIDFCVPENISMHDLQDIVWQYLDENQENDEFIASPAVALALYEVFPCE